MIMFIYGEPPVNQLEASSSSFVGWGLPGWKKDEQPTTTTTEEDWDVMLFGRQDRPLWGRDCPMVPNSAPGEIIASEAGQKSQAGCFGRMIQFPRLRGVGARFLHVA